MVDPNYVVVAKINKRFLPRRGAQVSPIEEHDRLLDVRQNRGRQSFGGSRIDTLLMLFRYRTYGYNAGS
jgi:hypothetical protein